MEKLNKATIIGGIIIIALLSVIAFKLNGNPINPLGSISNGSAYKTLSTAATTSPVYMIKTGPGTLGSVVINTLGTGNIVFYDATSTIPTYRTIQATSSLPIIGYVSASQAAGTYTYDVSFYGGLMAVYGGAQGTSTITFR
jgi:hypothetical protein